MLTSVIRPGLTYFQFDQRTDQCLGPDDIGFSQDGIGSTTLMFFMEKDNGVYTFTDPIDDTVLGTARVQSALKQANKLKLQNPAKAHEPRDLVR
jgi:hypothetical protein